MLAFIIAVGLMCLCVFPTSGFEFAYLSVLALSPNVASDMQGLTKALPLCVAYLSVLVLSPNVASDMQRPN